LIVQETVAQLLMSYDRSQTFGIWWTHGQPENKMPLTANYWFEFEQGLTSLQTHYRSYRGPNQQCQSTEGRHKTKLNQIQQNTKIHVN